MCTFFCCRLASHKLVNLALHMGADFDCSLQEFSLSVVRDWRSSAVGCCNPCTYRCQATQPCPNIGTNATKLESLVLQTHTQLLMHSIWNRYIIIRDAIWQAECDPFHHAFNAYLGIPCQNGADNSWGTRALPVDGPGPSLSLTTLNSGSLP